MNGHFQITTVRLRLRQWRDSDRADFARLTADPEVMAFFPATLSRDESDALVTRLQDLIADNGFGFWAVELLESGECIGFIGLHEVLDLPCGPGIEIGWRLARAHWGKGYATEGALAARDFAFAQLDLDELSALAVVANFPSRAVMTRIGMTDTGRNFAHPRIAADSPLSEHVLYSLQKSDYEQLEKAGTAIVEWISTN